MSLKNTPKSKSQYGYTVRPVKLLQELGYVKTACVDSNIKKRLFSILKKDFSKLFPHVLSNNDTTSCFVVISCLRCNAR